MSLRFFNDFDDLFGDHDVTFSLLPLRMPDQQVGTKKCNKPSSSSASTINSRLAHMDITEGDNDCLVQIDLPGVNKEDIQVHFDDATRLLTVEAERKSEFTDEKAPNFFHQERYFGRLQRSVTLPENVDGEQVEASMDAGVLKLKFGKKPEKETRKKITIN